ncbi:signal recognition particle-docking protein FtsY [Aestuariivirga litoralis]|uniref:signal recognition particle-docking protein FtsY n=1 Tax=Aestuariivirga litoralis TaxID=2650924 RepID=UPI0018C6D312|nr:signal recognition particle-docking protein FtsY [Aestuariivirga litoralis]MBG1233662.1 signal recognition particle-docking protein FtsY [Aestuariivirga litoralis]
MAGFFKKLFNRITGKPDEAPPPAEQAALPAPEPEVEVIVAPEPAPAEPEVREKAPAKPKAPSKKEPPAKKEPPPKKTSSPKKAEPEKEEAKKAPAKKAEPEKPAPRTKKAEPEKPVAKAKKPQLAPEPVVEEPIVEIAPVIVEPPPPPPPAPVPAVVEAPQRSGWFSRLKDGLSKSSKGISGSITAIFTKRKLDKETLQDLEDTLIQADLGLAVAERIIARVSDGRYDKEVDPEEVKQILASEVAKVLKPVEVPFNFGAEKPFVIMVVGVNGSGKTTTIGKLGSIAAAEGFKVMFAAGDTFRAAAIEQLTVWGQRIGAETISRPTGADAAGLAFDALKQAQDSKTDILFIDTAGRLQNKAHLMDELDKLVRVIKKLDAGAPHAVLLVLDATTGQNALAQAEVFTKVAGVTGLIMTKLDGTARGGILVAIAEKFKLPIHAVGVGEQIDDLQPFDAEGFARAIAGLDEK